MRRNQFVFFCCLKLGKRNGFLQARELEKLDPTYGRQFRQRIDELRQRLVCLISRSRIDFEEKPWICFRKMPVEFPFMAHGIRDSMVKMMCVFSRKLFSFLKTIDLLQKLGQQQRDLLIKGYASANRTGETLKDTRQIAHETEQLGHEIMSDLTQQRETLLRTQNKVRGSFVCHELFWINAFLGQRRK